MRKSSGPSLCRNSITVTGCACYHGFSSSTKFDQGWQCCADGCDHQLFTLVYWQPWWKTKTILLTSKRWIANGNAVIFCETNWTFKSRFMSCILIHELRIFNWLTPIMWMYQVPTNHKLCKITLFSPTLLKLAVLFRWLRSSYAPANLTPFGA